MPSIGQENLETVMIDVFGALRRGDFDAAAGLLDPDVSWQGLREEWVCHGRCLALLLLSVRRSPPAK